MAAELARTFVAEPIRELGFGGRGDDALLRSMPVEAPIAFEYDGVGYAVMMGTPAHLEDFARGFTLAERLVGEIEDIEAIETTLVPDGWLVRIALRGVSRDRLRERVRLRLVEGSCGLCGIESIEQALRPLPLVGAPRPLSRYVVASALAALRSWQPLGRETGAAHAAAFCDDRGKLRIVREDVGRHNALDKLVGALAVAGIDPRSGFMLLTARCSYELVEKTVLSGCPMLVTISAATSLAVERARAAALTLVSLARSDSMLVVNDPHGSFVETNGKD